jgi:hypothetical protein
MNKHYNEVMCLESITRRKNWKICNDGLFIKRNYLWKKRNHKGDVLDRVSYNNLVFLEENLYLTIPFPLKQQR